MQAKFDSCSGTVGNKLYRLQKHAERDVNRTIHFPIEVIYSNLPFSTELDWFYSRNSANFIFVRICELLARLAILRLFPHKLV